MAYDETEALVWSSEKRRLELDQSERVLILNALPGPYFSSLPDSPLCLQTSKPLAESLEKTGHTVVTSTDAEDRFDLILFFGTKYHVRNRYMLGRGLQKLQEGGKMVCSFPNSLGASRYRKDFRELFGREQSLSKYKCKVFWATRTPQADLDLSQKWVEEGSLQRISQTDLYTYPGTFSSDELDTGSLLLSRFLPKDLTGVGADLGAGYGFLSYALLQQSPAIQSLDLYEAEFLGLEAAKHNLRLFSSQVDLTFHWYDVTKGLQRESLDWIIMNPPFHSGQSANVQLGRTFIEVAADALRPGGTLYFVANVHLPYEKTLKTHYSSADLLAQEQGFKVYRACR